MEIVFTNEEWSAIRHAAAWSWEEVNETAPWLSQLQAVCAFYTPAEKESCLPELYFYPIWAAVEMQVRAAVSWVPPADFLNEYRDAFIEEAARFWLRLCSQVSAEHFGWKPMEAGLLENREKISDYICSGQHFHDCALQYPLFARLLVEFSGSAFRCLAEFLTNLEADRVALYRALYPNLGKDGEIPPVVSISGPKSDRHEGRTVLFLDFADGTKAVYKPHSAATDLFLEQWLQLMCVLGGEEPFVLPRILNRAHYSYFQFIRPHTFSNESEVKRYFYRAGFLMGAITLLGGTDNHADNLIAAADPVIVDTEMILGRIGERGDGSLPFDVTGTFFLPSLCSSPGYYIIGSSLCDAADDRSNLPQIGETLFSAIRYPDEVCSGFRKIMETFIAHREEIHAFLVQALPKLSVRDVLRPTYSYFLAFQAFTMPNNMKNAQTMECALTSFLRRTRRADTVEAERRAICRMDFPRFAAPLTEQESERLFAYHAQLNEAAVSLQEGYIRFLLEQRIPGNGQQSHAEMPCAGEQRTALVDMIIKGIYRKTGIVSERSDHSLYIMPFSIYMLEGQLGAVVALAAWHALYGMEEPEKDAEVKAILEEFRQNLVEPSKYRFACSILETGLAEGIGGFLSGTYLLYAANCLPKETFYTISETVLQSLQKAVRAHRVFSTESSFLYGWNGTLFALGRISEDETLPVSLREALAACRAELCAVLPEMPPVSALKKEIAQAAAKYDSLAVFRQVAVPFVGLFYGGAGELFVHCRQTAFRQGRQEQLRLFGYFDENGESDGN